MVMVDTAQQLIRPDLPRLLQHGDIVLVCGQRGEVVGVELGHAGDEEYGPTFVIDLADGTTTTAQTRAVEVIEPFSPAPTDPDDLDA